MRTRDLKTGRLYAVTEGAAVRATTRNLVPALLLDTAMWQRTVDARTRQPSYAKAPQGTRASNFAEGGAARWGMLVVMARPGAANGLTQLMELEGVPRLQQYDSLADQMLGEPLPPDLFVNVISNRKFVALWDKYTDSSALRTCGRCGQDVPLTGNSVLRQHQDPATRRRCPGSLTRVTETDAEAPDER